MTDKPQDPEKPLTLADVRAQSWTEAYQVSELEAAYVRKTPRCMACGGTLEVKRLEARHE